MRKGGHDQVPSEGPWACAAVMAEPARNTMNKFREILGSNMNVTELLVTGFDGDKVIFAASLAPNVAASIVSTTDRDEESSRRDMCRASGPGVLFNSRTDRRSRAPHLRASPRRFLRLAELGIRLCHMASFTLEVDAYPT